MTVQMNETPPNRSGQGYDDPLTLPNIAQSAEAFARILCRAAKRVREGEAPFDVVQRMMLVEVVTVVSGRV